MLHKQSQWASFLKQSSTSARSVCSIVRLRCLVRRDSEAVSFENAPFFRPYIRFSESIAVGKCVSRERHRDRIIYTSTTKKKFGKLSKEIFLSIIQVIQIFFTINAQITQWIFTDYWYRSASVFSFSFFIFLLIVYTVLCTTHLLLIWQIEWNQFVLRIG